MKTAQHNARGIYIMRTRAARSGRAGKAPRVRYVCAERFREARYQCVLSQQATAKLLRVSLRTVRNWEIGATAIPYAAYKLMRILRGFELPGEDWRGWRLIRGTLWSPEGRGFRARDHAWWSLLVAQADAFRKMMRNRRAPASLASSRPPVAHPAPTDVGSARTPASAQDDPGASARDASAQPIETALAPSANRGLKSLNPLAQAIACGGNVAPPQALRVAGGAA